MKFNPSPNVRFAIYVVVAAAMFGLLVMRIVTPEQLTDLAEKVVLATAAATSVMAAFNVSPPR